MCIEVSIIVPVYNVEKYLNRCVESLLNQTYKNIEIILVNDASPDNSIAIMKEYEKKYPDIIKCIYLTKNVRQGGARNRGLKIAKGKFICFVDSDDWVDSDYIDKLYNKACNTNSDIVYCNYKLVDDSGREDIRTDFYEQQIGNRTLSKRKMSFLLTGTGPCWCIIKKEILIENNLLFPEQMLYEDMAICPLFAQYAKRMDYVEDTYYYYYQRENSVVHDVDADFQEDEAKAILHLYNECEKRKINLEMPVELEAVFTKYYYAWGINDCFFGKYSVPPKRFIRNLVEEIHKIYPKYYCNPYFYGNIEPRLISKMLENDYYLAQELKSKECDYKLFYFQPVIQTKLDNLMRYMSLKKCALWGDGKKGRDFLISCKNSENIDCVIDKNEKIQNTKLETGHRVLRPEAGLQEVEYVIVSNKNHYPGIKLEVKKTNSMIKVINLDLYLLFDMAIEECMR